MAESEEVKRAGIGINVAIDGLDGLTKVNETIESMRQKIKPLTENINQMRDAFNHFGGSDTFTKANSSVDKLSDNLNIARKATQNVNITINDMHKSLDTVAEAGKKAKDNVNFSSAVDKSSRSINSLQSDLGRLNGDKVTRIKGDFNETSEAVKKSGGNFQHFNHAIDDANERTKRLHDMLISSFIGNAISNGISTIGNDLMEAAKQGWELVEGGERITNQWKNIGLSDAGAKKMTDQIGEIRGQSNMAGGQIDLLQKKFYALTNSTTQSRKFTEEIAAFGSAAGKDGQQIDALGNGLARVMGSKKVSAGFFQRAMGQMPALQKAIVKASGMTNAAFDKALQGGKITGSKLQEYMSTAAKKSSVEWAAFAQTTQGKIAGLKGTWQNLTAVFAKPVVSGISEAIEKLAKGKGGIAGVQKSLKAIANTLGEHVGNMVGSAIEFIVKNRKPLNEIVSSLGRIAGGVVGGAWKEISSALSVIGGQSGKASKGLNSTAKSIEGISRQKTGLEAVGQALVAMFVVTKVTAFGRSLNGARKDILAFTDTEKLMSMKTLKAGLIGLGAPLKSVILQVGTLTAELLANPWTYVALAIVAVGAALVKLYKSNTKFRKFVNGIAKDAQKAFGQVARDVGHMVKVVSPAINAMAKFISQTFGRIAKQSKKQWGNMWGQIFNVVKSAYRTIKSLIETIYDFITGRWGRLGKDMKKLTSSMWDTIKNVFKAGYTYVDDLTGGRLSKLIKAFQNAWDTIGKGWHDFWNGLDKWMGNLWNNIVKTVQNGINGVIKVLNAGIGGIDSVIHFFGGKSNTVSKISPVHLATGTGVFAGQRKAITKPTMSILNDGHDSPQTHNHEVIMHANGGLEEVRGTNVMKMLEPQAEVFNASEARELGLTHFAKGTGFLGNVLKGVKSVASDAVGAVDNGVTGIGSFVSKAWSGAKNLAKILTKIGGHPVKYLNSLMKRPTSKTPIISDFATGFYSNVKSQANDWWSEVWNQISGAAKDGGGAGTGGTWRHNPGMSMTDRFGDSRSFGSHDGVDFSGPMGSAILAVHGGTVTRTGNPVWDKAALGDVITVASSDGWQEIYQEFGGMNNIKVKKGDVIKTGQRIATLGALNGSGSGSHVHIGVAHGSLWDHGGTNTHGWYDVTKMHGNSNGTPKGGSKNKKDNSYLSKLVKGELGSGMFKWIKKHLAPLFSDATGAMGDVGLSGGLAQRAREIAKALKSAYPAAKDGGIAGVLGNWIQESRLDPSAIDAADHGSGLGQWTFGRETAMRNWTKKHGYAWNSAKGQLDFALHEPGMASSFKSTLRMSSLPKPLVISLLDGSLVVMKMQLVVLVLRMLKLPTMLLNTWPKVAILKRATYQLLVSKVMN